MMVYNFAFESERIGLNLRPQIHENGRRQVALMSTRLQPMAASALEHLRRSSNWTSRISMECTSDLSSCNPGSCPLCGPNSFNSNFRNIFIKMRQNIPLVGIQTVAAVWLFVIFCRKLLNRTPLFLSTLPSVNETSAGAKCGHRSHRSQPPSGSSWRLSTR